MRLWPRSKWARLCESLEDVCEQVEQMNSRFKSMYDRLGDIEQLFEEKENENQSELAYLKEELARKTLLIETLFSSMLKDQKSIILNGAVKEKEPEPKTPLEAYKAAKDKLRDKPRLP